MSDNDEHALAPLPPGWRPTWRAPRERAGGPRTSEATEGAPDIARAREAQQHALVDQTVAMADAATVENWQLVRLQIQARQWRAGKLAPKT